MDLGLTGLRVLVIGGSGLIGSAVSHTMVAEGARVIVAGRTAATLSRLVDDLCDAGPGTASHVVLDTADTANVTAAIQAACEELNGLDVLINSGAPPASDVIAADDVHDDVAKVTAAFDAKAMGYLRCARAAIPHLLAAPSGRIINICGQHVHLTESLATSVRNVAVAAISKCLADELAETGVTVNVIHPGPVDAALTHPAPLRAIGRGTGLRIGGTTPTDVADLVAFLSSPRASTISGASIDIGHAVQGVSFF